MEQPKDYSSWDEDPVDEEERANPFVLFGLMIISWFVIIAIGNGLTLAYDFLIEAFK